MKKIKNNHTDQYSLRGFYLKMNLMIWIIPLSCIFTSCQKQFLDKKPNKSLLVPTTFSDFQALLDDVTDMNLAPYLNIISSDDIYTTDAGWTSAETIVQNSYIWAEDIYQGARVYDWNSIYLQVFYTNVVLDGLTKVNPDISTQAQWNSVRGTALFHRAFALYNLAQEFAAPYNPANAAQLPGIPVRLSSDVNIKSDRGTLQQTYDQIIKDLTEAQSLLPVKSTFVTRPNKPAACALLARVYQAMQTYDKAASWATACMSISDKLIDYNVYNATATRPFPNILPTNGNTEVFFFASLVDDAGSPFLVSPTLTIIDSTLYKSYADNDLRKTLFFDDTGNGIILFKGNYSNSANVFAGIALDEVYLIRAESYARENNISAAMKDLNSLLQKRYKTGTFMPLIATDANNALRQILTERRKELVYRNLRWADLRRLNQDTRFAITLTRYINGVKYTLPPNDNKYTFPIPDEEIASSGIEQNPR